VEIMMVTVGRCWI